MQIINEIKLDFDDVLIRPKRSNMGSRANVNLIRKFNNHKTNELVGIPIIASNMDTTGTFAMCRSLSKFQLFTCLHKFYEIPDLIKFFNEEECSNYAFYTSGITEADVEKLTKISQETKLKNICLDVANGYTKYFVEKVRFIRDRFPDSFLMAGNVATPEMVQELIISGGADMVKIGIGPGSACKTRVVTGVGYYQLSAIIECADAAHGLGKLICSDGGCSKSGDICKAFGAGADFVMLGYMFAGHEECEGEWEEDYVRKIKDNGVPYMDWTKKVKTKLKFYGMSSKEAMDKYYGGIAEHRASEGKCMEIDYKGLVQDTVQQILGGIRSACTYIGANNLKDFSKCTTFVKSK